MPTNSTAEVWTQPNCPYCTSAKKYLTYLDISYKEFIIGQNGITKADLHNLVPGARTVPQIFIDGQYVGGFAELEKKYDNS